MSIQALEQCSGKQADSRTDTRSAVHELLLEHGALTAAEIGQRLGLTAAAVRRHLDNLSSEGAIDAVRRRPSGGRGRPARAYQLTVSGRQTAAHGYDNLAAAAMHALRQVGGSEAVVEFSRQRIRALIGHIPAARSTDDMPRAAQEIADALSAAGYAASVEDAGTGVQICQHHCPVWSVASRFPELCQAEQEVLAEKVGSHVQLLATIAGGDCACTTNIPTGVVADNTLVSTVSTLTGVDASENIAERTVTDDPLS